MWIHTKDGFYSVILADTDPGADPLYMIRGRVYDDMERLMGALRLSSPDDMLEGVDIIEKTDTDYRYRVIVKPIVWANYLMMAGLMIDYRGVKDTFCHGDENTPDDDQRYDAMMTCWTAMNRLQRQKLGLPVEARDMTMPGWWDDDDPWDDDDDDPFDVENITVEKWGG